MSNIAISIRQPWAWLIIHAAKDIENRTWPTRFRGNVFIHASKGMTRSEYDEACAVAGDVDGTICIPAFESLPRGGIVGKMRIAGCVTQSGSPWFFGPFGFVIEAATSLPFQPCKGALGFFNAVITTTP